ncbi:MAG: L-2-amino-thiazoline-4-carboxylic acid hydrolase [Agathobacter sp.]|nr:L-2-amino-thiazoline-4-carboxylic acid hydrolase [Agathobacter sp.]
MGKLDKSFIFKKCKRFLNEKYGAEKSNAIWFAANKELNLLLREKKNVGSDEKMMVLPLCALYTVMKEMEINDALDVLKEYGVQAGDDISKMIYKITSLFGLSKLLWKNMPKLMRITSSPKKGYERRIISETSELVGVDILRCPLCEIAKELGVPEITEVICLIDKGQMTGFRYIDYTRTKALGNGDDFCDYRLRFNEER